MTLCEVLNNPLVLIDGECVLCNRTAQFVIKQDTSGKIRFAALQSERAMHELSSRGLPPPPEGTFVLIVGKSVFYRSDAALRLLGMLPLPWGLAKWLLVVPRFLRDAGYKMIARSRYRLLGRTSLCGLLNTEERKRFLSDSKTGGT